MTPQRAQDTARSNAILAWFPAVALVVAAAWPSLIGGQIPLIGLRNVAEARAGWPMAGASMALAVFMTVPGIHSRRTLLACGAVSIALLLVGVIFVGGAAGLPFTFLAANLFRVSWRPKPKPEP